MTPADSPALRDALKRVEAARNFPHNTCPASRHVQLMAEALAKGESYPMFADEPQHCAGSLLAVVAALYEARTQLASTTPPAERADAELRWQDWPAREAIRKRFPDIDGDVLDDIWATGLEVAIGARGDP